VQILHTLRFNLIPYLTRTYSTACVRQKEIRYLGQVLQRYFALARVPQSEKS